ncbi:MAG: RNA polymerase sigma factor [Myxococcales bacterium]|nr:RNA polymerase sigma factor [Myxococcales bacterium]
MTLVAVAPDPDPPPAIDPTVARAQAGDRDAFAQLYHQHVDRVYARLTRLVGPVPERDDLLQQTFLQVHRGLPTFRGDASVATYIHRVAVNVALDHLRARRRRPLDLDDAAVTAMAAAAPDPAARAASRQDLARVFAWLGELTPEQRVAFVLTAIEGLTAREAGALLGASPDAVKQRALAARRALLTALAAADRPWRKP